LSFDRARRVQRAVQDVHALPGGGEEKLVFLLSKTLFITLMMMIADVHVRRAHDAPGFGVLVAEVRFHHFSFKYV